MNIDIKMINKKFKKLFFFISKAKKLNINRNLVNTKTCF